MRKSKRTLLMLLCCALLLSAMPARAHAAGATDFPDVPTGIWYEPYLDKIIQAQQMVGQMNIISGYPDGSFKPGAQVKRGEWLKMLFEAAEASGNQTAFGGEVSQWEHWAKKYYNKALADNILVAKVYDEGGGQPMFEGTYDELEEPITRYEMAVILNNMCTNIAMQKTVIVDAPEVHITDYETVSATDYATAVEQSYGKGLLMGNENGVFHGADTLTRAEAATVLYRYLFQDTIKGDGLQDWASYPKVETSNYLDPSKSFANWLRQGHIDAWGNLDAEARILLFGDANKTYFRNSTEAAPFMVTVSVPVWTMDKAGNKLPSSTFITVHYQVAEEVKSIFQMIYDDPEQFPIYGGWSAGGARYTDTMRHAWGCAIDVNAYYNCECTINWNSGANNVTCGYGWWPVGHDNAAFSGRMTEQSLYSIGSQPGEYGYSVVKAFAAYGWGWGGNGYSKKSNGNQKFDFMHFSVLPSGG